MGQELGKSPLILSSLAWNFSRTKRATHTPAFPRDPDLSPLDGICSAVSFFRLSFILFLNAEVCPDFVEPEVYSIWDSLLKEKNAKIYHFSKFYKIQKCEMFLWLILGP